MQSQGQHRKGGEQKKAQTENSSLSSQCNHVATETRQTEKFDETEKGGT